MKRSIAVSSFANMSEDAQDSLRESLTLPEDILSDIIGDEEPDDINTIKEAIDNVK